jgi:hypothetical protein
MVAEDSQGEDGEREEVAAVVSVPAEEFGEEVRAVLGLGDDVPVDWVEGDGAEGGGEGGEKSIVPSLGEEGLRREERYCGQVMDMVGLVVVQGGMGLE